METANERRRRKLKLLKERYAKRGGLAHVAIKAGLNAQALEHIMQGVLLPPKADGTRTPRSLGNNAARRIEAALKLENGWFDAADSEAKFGEDALALAEAFDRLPQETAVDLELRQRLYWVIMQMLIAHGDAAQASIPAPAPAARPTREPVRQK